MSELETVVGVGTVGHLAEAVAQSSPQRFVRSKNQLALFDESRNPTGHVLTEWEALHSYGLDIIHEAVEYGSAILTISRGAAEKALRQQREGLGLSFETVAQAVGIDPEMVEKSESPAGGIPIHTLESIAFVLGLDERLLAYQETAGADMDLTSRLKTLQSERPARTVLSFAEAASIIRVQSRLQSWLGREMRCQEFKPTANYRAPALEAWQIGYQLAKDTRNLLGLGKAPIVSMRTLVEDLLGVPIIQAALPDDIAGATIATRDSEGRDVRGIVLNTVGDNTNVWIRRAVLAHELGHLLYDGDQNLKNVHVDSYDISLRDPQSSGTDDMEQRANAFAIEFLAPREQVKTIANVPIGPESIAEVMRTFGISHTAARYHLANACSHEFAIPSHIVNARPTARQVAAENFAVDYSRPEHTLVQRGGRFSGLVAECRDKGYLSGDTAAIYLGARAKSP